MEVLNTMLLCGAIFIIVGFILYKFPPKTINVLYGYRTKRAMKNQQVWNFAQTHSAKKLMRYGVYMIFTGLVFLFYQPFSASVFKIIDITLIFLFIILLIVTTEKTLKKKFKE